MKTSWDSSFTKNIQMTRHRAHILSCKDLVQLVSTVDSLLALTARPVVKSVNHSYGSAQLALSVSILLLNILKKEFVSAKKTE